jgi:Family of unknown function (DUF5677)
MSSERTPVDKAVRAIPRLRACLRDLVDLGDQMSAGARFHEVDHFAFMGLFFAAKQREHAVGILKLEDHPDSALIARSMLEGSWQMKWASRDPDHRAERWRAFSILYDWRTLRGKMAAGIPVQEERRRRIESRLAEVHDEFLKPSARRLDDAGQTLPEDPYVATWTNETVKMLAELAGGLPTYATLYSDFSDRHHWSPGGVGQGIQVDGERLHYDARSPSLQAQALSVALECLWDCSYLVNEHLHLGYDDRLNSIADRVIAAAHSHEEET